MMNVVHPESKPHEATATQHSAQAADELPTVVDYVKTYAKQNPDVAALWCFGIGFVLGWKLKPW
jgi:hypothetical protein